MTRQQQSIFDLLSSRAGQWVSLPDILNLRISQYSARIHELRKLGNKSGWRIENKTERKGGQTHSWFRLVRDLPRSQPSTPAALPLENTLFPAVQPQYRYPD